MSIDDLTDADAVQTALKEFDSLGQEAFLKRYHYAESAQYFVQHDDRLYDAEAIAGAAHGYQHPEHGPLSEHAFHGDAAPVTVALQQLGFAVVDGQPSTLEEELAWRLAMWRNLQARQDADGLLTAGEVRAVRAYGGQQGIWVDKKRTRHLDPQGLAVGLKHTGVDYPDEINDSGALYRYPDTNRRGQDKAEVNATKAASRRSLPVFLISERGTRREVRLGWVAGWEDTSSQFYVSFDATPPQQLLDRDRSDDHPFQLEGNRRRTRAGTITSRPDQAKFKVEVIHRYGSRCPFSGIAVPAMIEAAHLRPDAENGSSDPRNGIPMNAALHRAFDAHLFAIHPDTLQVMVRPQGPSLAELGIIEPQLALSKLPHKEALKWRYAKWLKSNKMAATEAVPPVAAAAIA
ncbi:HNH endonuclease [Kitasatospora hibisci]|uniref:HNH endonuclease n=1 Tax=Kitasatospora hibisci TaxID=3369522 RepID=UPI00375507EF